MEHPNHRVTAENIREWARNDNRGAIIAWLCWNDRNGCFTDEACELEGFDPLTSATASEIALDMLSDYCGACGEILFPDGTCEPCS